MLTFGFLALLTAATAEGSAVVVGELGDHYDHVGQIEEGDLIETQVVWYLSLLSEKNKTARRWSAYDLD